MYAVDLSRSCAPLLVRRPSTLSRRFAYSELTYRADIRSFHLPEAVDLIHMRNTTRSITFHAIRLTACRNGSGAGTTARGRLLLRCKQLSRIRAVLVGRSLGREDASR
jgi:hypothetical protein